tara:strand:+ start:77589 stop:78158 length:570 start_codon:yes stop_codon:yes gene_type:complete
MNHNLKNLMHKHYESKNLSEDQLENLMNIQKEEVTDVAKNRKQYRLAYLLSAVATILIIFGLNFNNFSHKSIPQEVAYNHLKQMPVEIKTNNISLVRTGLTKLDFNIIASHNMKLEGYELVGARYCSIQGRIAAQLRYQHKVTGKFSTLYQVSKDSNNQSSIDKVEFIDGVEVKGWSEKGLILLKATSE